MISLLKGMGKAYSAHRKAKKADKLYQSQRTDKYSGNVTDPNTIKLNKQLKTAKQVGAGVAGTIAGASVIGKIKQINKDKKKKQKNNG